MAAVREYRVSLKSNALFPLPTLASFCAPGMPLHRSFGYVMAVRSGSVLLAPVGSVDGDLRQLRDGCPVPWEEVAAVIDTPLRGRLLQGAEMVATAPRLAHVFSPYGWSRDLLGIGPGPIGAVRLVHENGLRCAFVPGMAI